MKTNSLSPSKMNRERALAFVRGFLTGDVAATEKLLAPNFMSHVPLGIHKTAREKLLADVAGNKGRSNLKIDVVRSFANDDFALVHMRCEGLGPKPIIVMEVIRFNDQHQIAEQWLGMEEEFPKNKLGYSQYDGESKVTDENKTAANVEIIKKYFNSVLGRPLTNKDLAPFAENYIYHSTSAFKPGVQGTIELLNGMAARHMIFQINKVYLLFGEGNFVFVGGEAMATKDHENIYYIFRLQDNKIAEHWEVVEAAPVGTKLPSGFKKW